jgi:hypothetical protein
MPIACEAVPSDCLRRGLNFTMFGDSFMVAAPTEYYKYLPPPRVVQSASRNMSYNQDQRYGSKHRWDNPSTYIHRILT